MIKKIALVLILAGSKLNAQKGSQIEGTLKVDGVPGFVAKTLNMTMKFYQKGNKSLTEIARSGGKQFMLYAGENVTLTDGKDCYSDTKSEIAKYKDDDYTIENVTVKPSQATRTILGYECKSTLISYTTKAKGYSSAQEVVVWYTDKINVEGLENMAAIEGTEQDNDYTRALRNLGGFILCTEQTLKGMGMKTTFTVTKIEFKEFGDALLNVDTSGCKKMMTYKEFKEEMKRREIKSKAGGF